MPDTRSDPAYSGHAAAKAFPNIGSYVGVPVVLSDGTLYGTLCAVDPEPREFEPGQADTMGVLARLLVTHIERGQELQAVGRIQRALERQAEILRRQVELLDLAHDAILVRELETSEVIYWNEGAERIYGWAKGEAVGRVAHELLQTRFPKPLEEIHAEVIVSERWEGELTHTRRDGGRIVVDSRWALQRDDQGEPVAILEINSDITRRKEIERQLSEERFHSLVRDTTDIITICGADGVIRYQSPSVERALGYESQELVGTSILSLIHPEDVADAQRLLAHMVHTPDLAPSTELRLRHRDGEWRYFEVIGRNLLDEPSVRGIVVNARDISERKRAQGELELYRRMVEGVTDYAIFRLDRDGRVTSWNAGAQRIKGYRAEEIIGEHFSCFYTPEDISRGHPGHELEVAAAEGRFEDEGWRIRKDGSRFWANVVLTALRDEGGRLIGYSKITRDLTERKRAEAERTAKQAAEEANQAKSEFLSRMSHELRTPLNAILGFGELLTLDEPAPRKRRQSEMIVKSGKHLLGLIDEVLDIAGIEAGRLRLSVEPVAIREIVLEALDLVRPLAMQRGIQLEDTEVRASDDFVLADRQRLKQVLLNLLSNAIKYNRDHGWVAVYVEPVAPGEAPDTAGTVARRLRIKVADTGPGIPPGKMERVFAPFDRLGA
ncbi:MAG: PAS domain S-box protein, partial [Chloroflexota bacterium]|nr:PAS domain S-box protein [Chloroflexota bacterium]